MQFIVIDEAILADDRLCFYFKLMMPEGIMFAAKQRVQGEESYIKSSNINDVIGWMNFSPLALELFRAAKFSKKYRPQIFEIIPGSLNIVKMNDQHAYFIKAENSWDWTESTADVELRFDSNVTQLISSIMGPRFVEEHEKFLAEQNKISMALTESITSMRKMNKDIKEGNIASKKVNNEPVAKDIEEVTCSVS